VFLYLTASIFIYGGELNAVILKERVQAARMAAQPPDGQRDAET